MATELTMPQMGYDMQEGTLVRWLKAEGSNVELGEPVAEIETDKAVVEFESYASGVLQKILVTEGSTVPVGEAIALVGDVIAAPPPAAEPAAPDSAVEAQPEVRSEELRAAIPLGAATQVGGNGASRQTPSAGRRVFATPVARQMAQDAGIDLADVEGTGPGGRIVKEDILKIVEASSTPDPEPVESEAMDEPAVEAVAAEEPTAEPIIAEAVDEEAEPETVEEPTAETIAEEEPTAEPVEAEAVAEDDEPETVEEPTAEPVEAEAVAEDGEPETVEEPSAEPVEAEAVAEDGEPVADEEPTAEPVEAEAVAEDGEPETVEEPSAEPVEAEAVDEEVEPETVEEPSAEAVTIEAVDEDVEPVADEYPLDEAVAEPAAEWVADSEARTEYLAREEYLLPLSRTRQQIARVTIRSKNEKPHFYVNTDVDMSKAMALRAQVNEAMAGEGVRATVNDMIIAASVLALKRFPKFNAYYRDSGIRMNHEVNVGVAMAVEEGLIMPAIVGAGNMSLKEIAQASKDIAARAQQGILSAQEYSGGTFAISNMGMMGVTSFVAIIQPPQSAVLAIGAVQKRAVVTDDDQIVVRQMMTATLSADHRIVDGAEGAMFINAIKDLLENPLSIIL